MATPTLLPFECRGCGQLVALCPECPAPVDAIGCPCGTHLCEACSPGYVNRRGEPIANPTPAPLFTFPRGIFGQQSFAVSPLLAMTALGHDLAHLVVVIVLVCIAVPALLALLLGSLTR